MTARERQSVAAVVRELQRLDARVVVMCRHVYHTHHGVRGGRCRSCAATWCTLNAYACDRMHL